MGYLGKCRHCGGKMWLDSNEKLVCEGDGTGCLCELASDVNPTPPPAPEPSLTLEAFVSNAEVTVNTRHTGISNLEVIGILAVELFRFLGEVVSNQQSRRPENEKVFNPN